MPMFALMESSYIFKRVFIIINQESPGGYEIVHQEPKNPSDRIPSSSHAIYCNRIPLFLSSCLNDLPWNIYQLTADR
jgi:hypothetical protein